MNSVFSAFKSSSKSEGSIQTNKSKKLGPANSSSYANLRHIREIGSSAKMSSFVGDNDNDDNVNSMDIAANLRLGICAAPSPASSSTTKTALASNPVHLEIGSREQCIPLTASSSPLPTLNSIEDHDRSNCLKLQSTEHVTDKAFIDITNNDSMHNKQQISCIDADSDNRTISNVMTTESNYGIDNIRQQQSTIPVNNLTKTETFYLTHLSTPLNSTQTIATQPSSITATVAATPTIANMGSDHHINVNNHLKIISCNPIENKENNDKTAPSLSTSNVLIGSCVNETSIATNCLKNSIQLCDKVCPTAPATTTAPATSNDTHYKHTPILSAASNKKQNNKNSTTTTTTTASSTANESTLALSNKNNCNRLHKRLSISGIGNNPLPSVHGRSTSNTHNGSMDGAGETKRNKISTHQRNLSLDFR